MSTPSIPRRYLSIWLRRLPTDRLARRESWPAESDAAPLVVVHMIKSALRVAAMNDAAARLGLTIGTSLADARARHPALQVAPSDPEADRRLLEAVADWCDRYTPLVAIDAPSGAMLDIAGCAHLFGGEPALCRDIVTRLAVQGLRARTAVADTPGCAWAVARHGVRNFKPAIPGEPEGRGPESITVVREHGFWARGLVPAPRNEEGFIVPPGGMRKALAPLPLAALRLDPEIVSALADVGFNRIADVLDLPRSVLAARFDAAFLRRLDQALGCEDEPITPKRPAPAYMAEQHFAEPIARERDVLGTIARLSIRLGYAMETRGEGARLIELSLFRTDGAVHRLAVGAGAPLHEASRIGRLFKDRLATMGEACDPGFGYDLVRLCAPVTERCAPAQVSLGAGHVAADHAAELGHLIDRLGARFGLRRVTRLAPQDAHIPEFAVVALPAHFVFTSPRGRGEVDVRAKASASGEGALLQSMPLKNTPHPARRFASRHPLPASGERVLNRGALKPFDQDTLAPARPARLFARPERIEAVAEVPDGPPVRFRWRRVLHEVAAAEGPERIALEWWRDEAGRALTRDYFRVETRAGVRVWLYREGLYGRETAQPRWFLHGLFG